MPPCPTFAACSLNGGAVCDTGTAVNSVSRAHPPSAGSATQAANRSAPLFICRTASANGRSTFISKLSSATAARGRHHRRGGGRGLGALLVEREVRPVQHPAQERSGGGDAGEAIGVLQRRFQPQRTQHRQQGGFALQAQARQDETAARPAESRAAQPGRIGGEPGESRGGRQILARQHHGEREATVAVRKHDSLEPGAFPVAGREVVRPHPGRFDRPSGLQTEPHRRGQLRIERTRPEPSEVHRVRQHQDVVGFELRHQAGDLALR